MLGLLVVACAESAEPPGAGSSARPWRTRVEAARSGAGKLSRADASERGARVEVGSIDDNLPFEPDGAQLVSLAWRTWIYTDVGPRRTRYGYLRAGAIVPARGPAIVNEGCAGGWYRINPRGFVCVGRGAGLDPTHPVATQENVRPVRGAGLPYRYALVEESTPHLYFRLPSADEMRRVEGDAVATRAALWRHRVESGPAAEVLGDLGAPPEFLLRGDRLHKPYGVEQRLHRSISSGQVDVDSGFALKSVFLWEGRGFGFTTEHDLLPLDRSKLVVPSSLRGVLLSPDQTLPVGFVASRYALRHALDEGGALIESGQLGYREGLVLTGRVKPGGVVEATDGSWVPNTVLRRIEPRTSFPSFATGNRKWVDISIREQSLVAYEGRRPVYATLVSTGRGGLGDPEKVDATLRGSFMIHHKSVSSTMDGDEDRGDSFALKDVPFVQYFHRGYALHGTYWHDEFGRLRSHGCVNLSPIDSAWLFEWTDPPVPEGWHAVLNKERGTVVHVRP